MAPRTLCERYCEVFHCSPQEFSERVFWQCLPPRVVRVARLIRPAKNSFFKPDFELIEHVAASTSLEDMRAEFEDFRYHHPRTGLLRGVLRVRVSGKRLLKLGATMLPPEQPNIPAKQHSPL